MAGQAPFQPQDFAMGKRPQAMGGFTEENIPSAEVGPTFSEQDLPSAQIMDFVKGTTDSASDEALVESTKHLQTPEAIKSLMLKGKADSGDEGGFTDSLTTSEKVALGLLAIMPLIGGALGGEDGALIAAGAGGQGLATFGKVELQQGAARKKAAVESSKLTAQKDRDTRKIKKDLLKDWNNDKVHVSFRKTKDNVNKLMASLNARGGVADLTSIIQLMKILDEGSVVREGEVAVVEASQDVRDKWDTLITRLSGKGQKLGPNAKEQIREIANSMVKVHSQAVRHQATEIRRQAFELQIEPDSIIPQSIFDSFEVSPIVLKKREGDDQAEDDNSPSGVTNFLNSITGQTNEETTPDADGKVFKKTRMGTFEVLENGNLRRVGP